MGLIAGLDVSETRKKITLSTLKRQSKEEVLERIGFKFVTEKRIGDIYFFLT
jgi:ribosomal protein L12E/L44/L45/RPP1/RPP2